jgi:Icc-related predicted phosphoesterase
MKIYLTSDIHLEFGDLDFKNEHEAEVLILSGDIMIASDLNDHPVPAVTPTIKLGQRQSAAYRYRDFLKRCSDRFPHVIYVAGNHEFYHGKWPGGMKTLRDECAVFPNVYFLEKESKVISDITFIGCTLWTDMNRGDPVTLNAITGDMNDFTVIRNDEKGYTKLRPAQVMYDHHKAVNYIRDTVENGPDEKFVVVGHHAPSKLSTHPRYADDYVINGGYSSDLSEFILDHPKIKLWTHGHTHYDFDYVIGETRIVANPRGYIGYEAQADHFRPKLIEV